MSIDQLCDVVTMQFVLPPADCSPSKRRQTRRCTRSCMSHFRRNSNPAVGVMTKFWRGTCGLVLSLAVAASDCCCGSDSVSKHSALCIERLSCSFAAFNPSPLSQALGALVCEHCSGCRKGGSSNYTGVQEIEDVCGRCAWHDFLCSATEVAAM